jgi:zinc transporter ZupT
MRPLRILWNEIMGFLFLCFGVWFSAAAFRSFRNLDKPNGSPAWVFLSGFAAAVMLYYGVSSFLRARKIGRS